MQLRQRLPARMLHTDSLTAGLAAKDAWRTTAACMIHCNLLTFIASLPFATASATGIAAKGIGCNTGACILPIRPNSQ